MANKLLIFILLVLPMELWAQSFITGKLYDFENRKTPLQNVLVKNLTSDKLTYTKASGEFKVAGKTGDLLEFSLSGYHTDTLYLINLSPKVIYLPVNTTDLKEVNIVGAKVNPGFYTPDKDVNEFKRVQTDGLRGKGNNDRAGGLKFNLGYGKYRKQQEKIKSLEQKDKYETEINKIFTEAFVSDLTKLKHQELKDFMSLYRPDAALVATDEPFDYTSYTVKAYSKWVKLSPVEKSVPAMPKLKRNNK